MQINPENSQQRLEPAATQVVVETPRGSRNKYKFDELSGRMKLSKVMPEGMVFPYDFGFFPETRGEDGTR
jgi:inorganic pyrophosphatase